MQLAPSTLHQWLEQGQSLYDAAIRDYHEIEAQIDELEARLVAKRTEVNQIAQIIGKPPAEGNRRLAAELVSETVVEGRHLPDGRSGQGPTHIARALAGKFGR